MLLSYIFFSTVGNLNYAAVLQIKVIINMHQIIIHKEFNIALLPLIVNTQY